MATNNWPVSVSIGIAVYVKSPASAGAAIDAADKIMYQVKQSGKNSVLQEVVS